MRTRHLLVALLIVGITFGLSTTVPAQTPTRKVIEVLATSYKFEPSQIQFNEGDTVVIRLRNVDPRPDFAHSIATRYWADIPLTVRGDFRQGVSEGRRWVTVEPGKQAEIEFVAKGRGSFAFICGVFNHAERGQTGAFFVLPPGSP